MAPAYNREMGKLQRLYLDGLLAYGDLERIAQRAPEQRGLNLENVTGPRLNTGPKANAIGAEEMHVDIARPPELVILEVVVFEIGQRV